MTDRMRVMPVDESTDECEVACGDRRAMREEKREAGAHPAKKGRFAAAW